MFGFRLRLPLVLLQLGYLECIKATTQPNTTLLSCCLLLYNF